MNKANLKLADTSLNGTELFKKDVSSGRRVPLTKNESNLLTETPNQDTFKQLNPLSTTGEDDGFKYLSRYETNIDTKIEGLVLSSVDNPVQKFCNSFHTKFMNLLNNKKYIFEEIFKEIFQTIPEPIKY